MLESREETSRRCRANEAQRPAPQGQHIISSLA